MKRILGLDLGTNSIGWALVEIDHEKRVVKIIGLGSRILPMDAGEIGDFERGGKIKSSAAQRTEKRGARRLNERYLLRRDRLHLVLDLLDALPTHYKLEIDFTNSKGEKCGQFKTNKEPKLAYLPKHKSERAKFLFMDSYEEMLDNINDDNVKNIKGKRIPYDWTLYYLRQKALSEEISLEELAWVLLSYNQKRGYEKTEVEDKSTKDTEFVEELDLRVLDVFEKEKDGKKYFEIHLDGNDKFIYNEYSDIQMTFKGDLKEVVKISKVDDEGNTDEQKTEYKIIDIYSLEIQKFDYEKIDAKHKYILTYKNGWIETKLTANYYSFKYKNALNKPYDYIVETVYDNHGNIKTQQGKERKLREPDFGDNSSDWTLLKKKTEKEALAFNSENGFLHDNGDVKKYISPKIYSVLKNDAKKGTQTKIIGGIFQVVDREFYREELNQIISTQKQFHNSLKDRKIFEQCVKTLYPKNESHQKSLLENKDAIQNLLVEDILLYQRPLKSKKSEIADCKYEIRYWKDVVDKETGEIKTKQQPVFIKVVSKSHPYFQEFRIWDKIHNLKLIQLEKEVNGHKQTNQDVTKEFFKSDKEYQELFNELNNRKSINQEQFLTYCKKKFNIDYNSKDSNFVWNFPEDEELKGNETRVSFATRFKRCGFSNYKDFLTQAKELELWHYLYSVSYKERVAKDKKSITTFFNNYFKDFEIEKEIKEKIINDFSNYPKFKSNYCAYSEKALKKFIPIISLGEHNNEYSWTNEKWYKDWQATLEIRKIEILDKLKKIDFSADKPDYSKVEHTDVDYSKGELPFPKGLFNVFKDFKHPEDFNKLNLTEASYLIYGRHSELAFAKHWKSPEQIREELNKELKQHSLNNPVAEKVLLEMMQIVADIWEYYGNAEKDFFSRIHVEVGRELKKSAKKKKEEYERMSKNRSQNKRLRQILEEFLSNDSFKANSNNSDHFERLKIAEEGAEHRSNIDKEFYEKDEKLKAKNISKKDIDGILKKAHITQQDFEKYKLWIEQGYRSPYSGEIIKLTDLFNGSKYNIDHVFPQASITNNSLSNKVVVEVELNKLKGDRTGREFIQQQKGQKYLGIPVCTEDEYEKIVKEQFSGQKRYILLSKEIPKGFIDSQLNTSRHIARKAMELLSHIVREQGEVEFRSKNVLPVTGAVTTELKRAWKLDEVWVELVTPRFIRLNELTQSNLFGRWQTSKKGQKYFDCDLDKTIRDKNEAYDIKRIDHRHHALDALIVALCTEEHVNYINNINANAKSSEYGKQKQIEKYRQTLKRKIKFTKKDDANNENDWHYMLPGEKRMDNAENSNRNFVIEMSYNFKDYDTFHRNYKKMILTALQQTIVTFKQNLRVINNRVNYYQAEPNTKQRVAQEPKTQKEINSSSNKYNWGIRRNLSKETFYGKRIINNEEMRIERELLNDTFKKTKIDKIYDNVVKQILLKYLSQFDTVKIPFEEAIVYFDALLEKEEFNAIINSNEKNIKSLDDLIRYLRTNNLKYDKTSYANLNVFVDKVTERSFRNEKLADGSSKYEIIEHPEIAFTPEQIEKMNEPQEIERLNNGIKHKPIKKVQVYQGFGKERPLSESEFSVKSKQYVVTAADSNLYLGFYERVYHDEKGKYITERKFKDIDLIELIEVLKQDFSKRLSPLPNKLFDNEMNEYVCKFTLSPLDLVYVPTEKEVENPSLVDIKNLSKEQIERIYKYIDGSEVHANFVPYSVAIPIWRFHGQMKKEIFKELNESKKLLISEKNLIQNEFGLGSPQNKNQNMIDGVTQIKKYCWKLEINRLGQIQKVLR
ncbi:MAG: hypothetical protein GX259_05695 [Bacteroidales bacterium]|nr:hypothetical protein [Bacteroidales bacterium]